MNEENLDQPSPLEHVESFASGETKYMMKGLDFPIKSAELERVTVERDRYKSALKDIERSNTVIEHILGQKFVRLAAYQYLQRMAKTGLFKQEEALDGGKEKHEKENTLG